jgi:hypothetical protein
MNETPRVSLEMVLSRARPLYPDVTAADVADVILPHHTQPASSGDTIAQR